MLSKHGITLRKNKIQNVRVVEPKSKHPKHQASKTILRRRVIIGTDPCPGTSKPRTFPGLRKIPRPIRRSWPARCKCHRRGEKLYGNVFLYGSPSTAALKVYFIKFDKFRALGSAVEGSLRLMGLRRFMGIGPVLATFSSFLNSVKEQISTDSRIRDPQLIKEYGWLRVRHRSRAAGTINPMQPQAPSPPGLKGK